MFREIKREIKKMVSDVVDLSYEIYPENAMFPHAVGFIRNSFYQEGLYNIVLDIDVWDRNQSTKNIDEISEKIVKRLDKWSFINDKVHFVVYLTSEFYVEDKENTLRRKTCTFEVQARKRD